MKENQRIEWKKSWRDEYLKWICGFANADGGVLVIGRDDHGTAVGVKNASRLLEEIPNKVRDVLGIMVDVNLLHENDSELIEIVVEPYPSPVSYKGEYHYRSGSTRQELKGAALERFLLKKRGRNWDDVPEPTFRAEDCSKEAIRLFSKHAAQSGRMDEAVLKDARQVILDNLELTEGSLLKRAACLMFSDRPQHYVSGAWIKIGYFHTDDDLRYQDEIGGSLFQQVERADEFLRTKYLKAYIGYDGLQRRERFLFPAGALREALLNAVVHKDYGSGIPIQISVYENRIVFWNPGKLPRDWTVADLMGKHPSHPFNPLLANAFFRAGYIEAWGRGIEKIHRDCREHGIDPPLFDYGMSGLMLTFRANPKHLEEALGEREVPAAGKTGFRLGKKLGKKLGKTRAAIIEAMQADPNVTIRELSETLGISTTAVEKNIRLLKSEGWVNRVGPAKGGHWEIMEEGQKKLSPTEKGNI